MRYLVSYENSSGGFDAVGMNNRWPISDLKTVRGVIQRVNRHATQDRIGKRFQVAYISTVTGSERVIHAGIVGES